MSTIRFLSQGDLDFSCGPLHSAHPTGDLSLLLLLLRLPPLYLLGGGTSLLSSPTPLLPSSLLPPPFLCSPLLLLTPHSAVTWHCARPSTQPKCAGFWTVPVALPPNRPTPPPLPQHAPDTFFNSSTSPPSPSSAPPSPPSPPSPSSPSAPPGFPAPSMSLPSPGPGAPHPLHVELPPGINMGGGDWPFI